MKIKKDNYMIILLVPAMSIFTVFVFWPILRTIYLSFFDWNMISRNKKFVMLDNYTGILTDPVIYKSLGNTFLYIIFLGIFNFILPYIFAYALALLISKLKNFYRAMIFFPSIISLVVASLIFLWLFNPMSGPISKVYEIFGIESPFWLKTNGLVILLVSIITAWKIFGYNLILLLAGILEVPTELIESAKIDKLSNFQIFIYIVLPMTSSTALYVSIMTVVYGLQQVFVPINVLTQGGPNNGSTNLVYSIYQYAFTFFQTGRASALAIITTLFFFILISLKIKILEKGVYYEN
ncbi:carbohydrate ABC transporter permease [Fusobacterium ulcerans]|uniref:carbohydrate ABC transporter permease n=1 Tax=Fusobacterium ulcerans TaxID=861 RepID=UPI001DF57276|nr:sugar ABC transporter permease [Fusobacterium ulcerans]HJH06581.1 sugar ABC transporter permease [Fusobacterium ulcerans]